MTPTQRLLETIARYIYTEVVKDVRDPAFDKLKATDRIALYAIAEGLWEAIEDEVHKVRMAE